MLLKSELTPIRLLLTAIDPSDFKDCIRCFKCETALEKIVYIYSNPSNDCAVDSIDQFPGLNTFKLREGVAAGVLPVEKTLLATY